MHGDIRDDWKLNEIERKADEANRRLHEIDALRESLARLECSVRELSAENASFQGELQECQDRVRELMPEVI
jgi:prefoldin subunit 5